MLLTELTGIKHLYQKTKYDLFKMLDERGIKFIGGGQYGDVIAHPSWNYVIKIFSDDQYLSFVHFAITHPNKHYPKMMRNPLNMHAFYRRLRSDPNKFWVVKIERLYPITDQRLLTFLVRNLEQAACHAVNHSPDKYISEYAKLEGPNGEIYTGDIWTKVFESYPWFKSLCLAYANTWGHLKGSPDIHSKNLMQRANGDIVIIDPVWEGESPYRAYDKWLKTEMDYQEDQTEVDGPAYLHKVHQLRQLVNHSIDVFDDDIPF